MFSDRCRLLKILLLSGVLILLCLYSQFSYRQLTYAQCLASPAGYDGARVLISRDVTVGLIEPDRFGVRSYEGDLVIEVPGGTENLHLNTGDYFQAITVFRRRGEGGYLELVEVAPAPLRRLKIAISILPVLLVGLLLVRAIRIENGLLVVGAEASPGSGERST